ncbi:MAG: hypothetical protein WC875_00215 [Candidatus Absconditabacterales bacterium]|jgi:hypothetical protein
MELNFAGAPKAGIRPITFTETPLSRGELARRKQRKKRKKREDHKTPLRNEEKKGYNPVLQSSD